MSTSVASFEFEPIDEGTRFTHVEHGVFFDQFSADGPNREDGRGLLGRGNYRVTHLRVAGLSNQSRPIRGPLVAGPRRLAMTAAIESVRRGLGEELRGAAGLGAT